MNHLPFYIPAVFVITVFLAIYLLYRASNGSRRLLLVIAAWMLVQTGIAATGFFSVTNTLPPRFVLLIILPLLAMVIIFSTTRGRAFTESFDLKTLTLLHVIRIPVEMVLFWLFVNKAMPQLMTFEGRNFDLFSGLTAPLVFYFGFVKRNIGAKALLAWNVICLLILLFTVTNAILSAPTPFQRFAFDQPTIAVLYFPFMWLPGVVVPIVIFSHLAAIRLLVRSLKIKTAPVLQW